MKKIKCFILLVVLILLCNQVYYLSDLQFKCSDKINQGKDLNLYEVASALQTHTAFWMFGWVVSWPTAVSCFEKQFHLTKPIYTPAIKDNEQVIAAKEKLRKAKSGKIRLAWKRYEDETSIYLNGAYISYIVKDGIPYYRYVVPLDYKPGTIDIWGIKLCETVFDYLENKHILSVYDKIHYQAIDDND